MKVLIKSTVNQKYYYVHAYETWKEALSKFCDVKFYGKGYDNYIGYDKTDQEVYEKLNFRPDIEIWAGGAGDRKPRYFSDDFILKNPDPSIPKVILIIDFWEMIRDLGEKKWREREYYLRSLGVVGYCSFYSQTEEWMKNIKTIFNTFFTFPYIADKCFDTFKEMNKHWDINLQFVYNGYPFRKLIFDTYQNSNYNTFYENDNHQYRDIKGNKDALYKYFECDSPVENFAFLVNSCYITIADGYTKYCPFSKYFKLDGTDLFNSRYPQVLSSSSVMFCPKIESTHIEELKDGVHYVEINERNFKYKIDYYLRNKHLLKEISKNANEWVKRNCTEEVVGKRIKLSLEKVIEDNKKEKILIIMGNGPSLKDVNFDKIKKYDCFGMNSAYRKYKELNFYPKYFGCFDYLVCRHHSDNFSKLIENTSIEKFFFVNPSYFSDEIKKNKKFGYLNFNDKYENKLPTFDTFYDLGCTGANCSQIGILLGYTKIILIGCDANYVNFVENSKKTKDGRLIIEKTPDKNPNYWFDDYQQTNDVYNIPNVNIYHIPAWNRLKDLADKLNIDIVNCSPVSKIECFRKSTLEKELSDY
jgi:hypothetical protein